MAVGSVPKSSSSASMLHTIAWWIAKRMFALVYACAGCLLHGIHSGTRTSTGYASNGHPPWYYGISLIVIREILMARKRREEPNDDTDDGDDGDSFVVSDDSPDGSSSSPDDSDESADESDTSHESITRREDRNTRPSGPVSRRTRTAAARSK